MTLRAAIGTAYGAPALDALRETIAELKATDLLAPVTIVVPNNIAGLVVRRALATGVRPGLPGIAGIHITTLARLAEQIAAPLLHPRTPATRAVIAAAWRAVLDYGEGPFAPVRDHPATIRALTSAYRELRELTPDELDRVEAAGSLQRELVQLYRRVIERVSPHGYDRVDLLARAASAIGATTRHEAVVLYLPQVLSPSESRLVTGLSTAADLTAIVGLTGVDRADEAIRRTITTATGATIAAGPKPPTATQVRHASDADDEVRGVVHAVLEALTDTPAHRIAVLYAKPTPYARILHEQFEAAGIAVNGPGVLSVVERAISRGLLGILELGSDCRRSDLFRALAHAPTMHIAGEQRVPVARWERISRLAGVVHGDDWDGRLRSYVDDQLAAIELGRADPDTEPARIEGQQRDAKAAEELWTFVRSLRGRLAEGDDLTTWPDLAEWAAKLFHDLYGPVAELATLPAEERSAAAAIEQTFPMLAGLGAVEPQADRGLLVEVLTAELEASLPRIGSFGRGVFIGPISSAVGLDADRTFVLGLSEDTYPGRTRVEALLPDRVRDLVTGLAGSRLRLDSQHRELLAALQSAPSVTASFARGDLRRNTARLPSRWLLPSLRELTGDHRLAATRWADVEADSITGAPSSAATLGRSPLPATEQEWRLRAAATGGAPDQPQQAAHELMRGRAGATLSRFDGNLVGAAALPDPTAEQALVSATRLESYADCPHAYFVRRLLGVQPIEQPEELIVISPLDIGTLIHEAMDEFVTSEQGRLPSYGQPWTPEQMDSLIEFGRSKAAQFELRGHTGHPLLWAAEERRILTDLRTMLEDDNQWRAELDAKVVASELTFGMSGHPPVVIPLPSGRSVRMRGSADKVDQARDGTLLVTDLKTGGSSSYKVLEDDPIAAGTKLQLPVYALAAQQRFGDLPVTAQYWFVRKRRRKGGPARVSVELDDAVEARFGTAVDTLVTGMAGGLFPAKAPSSPDFGWVQCPFCNPDGLGHSEVRERWLHQRADPILDDLVDLLEPETP